MQSLLDESQKRYKETKDHGVLTKETKTMAHILDLIPGTTYLVDLESTAFDPVLILEDANGKRLAENDDMAPGQLNSRIIFSPTSRGNYRLVATSFEHRGTGEYLVRIRGFVAKK